MSRTLADKQASRSRLYAVYSSYSPPSRLIPRFFQPHDRVLTEANVFLPKDRISMAHQGFGFCEFLSEDDADYAVKIMNQIKLYGKPIRVNKASYDTKKPVDVGANLFIGSLDEGVDENALFDTFSTFGSVAEHPKVSRMSRAATFADVPHGAVRQARRVLIVDCAGSVYGPVKGLRIRVVQRL